MTRHTIKRNIFLIDGLGALLSALLLGILLPTIQTYIGMSIFHLHILAFIALYFAIYSMSCHFFIKPKKIFWLKTIMAANFCYCLFTLALVIFQWFEMTILGIIYFLGEAFIILGLVRIETQVISERGSQQLN